MTKVRRIVFTGAECTGKSTITQLVAESLHEPYSLEFVREYRDQLDRSLCHQDLDTIARGQMDFEDKTFAQASRFVFHDTNLLSSILYAEHYFETHIRWVDQAFLERSYDRYFLCQPDIPWREDEGQREGPVVREEMQLRFKVFLDRYKIKYQTLEGTPEERLKTVLSYLNV